MGNPPSPALMKLAAAIRRHRKRAGLTQLQLANMIPCSDKTLSAIETGRERLSRGMVVAIETSLDLPPGTLVDLFDLADNESLPRWARDWFAEERRTSKLRAFELALIHGLVQTEEYARVLLKDESAVQARMDRQSILTADEPPTLHVVLDEAVLHREVGGPQIMHNQLKHLTECVTEKCTVQIVPSSMNPHRSGSFIIGTVDNGEVAYVETAVRGIVTSSYEDVMSLNDIWETIRTHALSQRESLEFIRRTAEKRWT